MSNQDLVSAQDIGNDFIASHHEMDLSELHDKAFIVAVSTGPRTSVKGLCSTLHGPYCFTEMLEVVGNMWLDHQHHAKAYILSKEQDKRVQFLDENTMDYIEDKFADIITDSLFDGTMEKQYTCKASIVTDTEELPNESK